MSLTGNTPPIQHSQDIMITIDDNPPYNASYADPTPPSYRQWYQSPVLTDGPHTILIEGIATTSVDFATVTAGESTPLKSSSSSSSSSSGGEAATLIVDDGSPAIGYTGNWTQDGGMFIGGNGGLNGMPFRNGTHRSRTPGDTAIFEFSGQSVPVYL